MRKGRFGEERIIGILKESEAGVETGELCRRHGITRASFYRPTVPSHVSDRNDHN